jgi:hypothetical protein
MCRGQFGNTAQDPSPSTAMAAIGHDPEAAAPVLCPHNPSAKDRTSSFLFLSLQSRRKGFLYLSALFIPHLPHLATCPAHRSLTDGGILIILDDLYKPLSPSVHK